MTNIKNTTTGEIIEAGCIIDGINILDDVMGDSGIEHDGEGFLLEDDEVAWWLRWAEREERIYTAYQDANEDERRECEKAIEEWGHDFEALQDAEEVALGLAGYTVTVYAADEASGDTYLTEHFATYDGAHARLEEITEEGGWGDNKVAAIFEILEGGEIQTSLEVVSL